MKRFVVLILFFVTAMMSGALDARGRAKTRLPEQPDVNRVFDIVPPFDHVSGQIKVWSKKETQRWLRTGFMTRVFSVGQGLVKFSFADVKALAQLQDNYAVAHVKIHNHQESQQVLRIPSCDYFQEIEMVKPDMLLSMYPAMRYFFWASIAGIVLPHLSLLSNSLAGIYEGNFGADRPLVPSANDAGWGDSVAYGTKRCAYSAEYFLKQFCSSYGQSLTSGPLAVIGLTIPFISAFVLWQVMRIYSAQDRLMSPVIVYRDDQACPLMFSAVDSDGESNTIRSGTIFEAMIIVPRSSVNVLGNSVTLRVKK